VTGTFTVSSAPPGSYILTAAKGDDVLAISAQDAALVLQHSVGLTTLTGNAAIAADVNRSGAITAMDAHYILQAAVGLISPPFPGAGVVWQFEPASRTIGGLAANVNGQDFTAILIGDVTGNWSSPAPASRIASLLAAPVSGSGMALAVDEGAPAADHTLTATVSLDSKGADLYSVDLVLTYDPALGNPVSIVKDPACSGWTVMTNTSIAGQIRVAMASAMPFRSTGAVLTVTFALVGEAKDVSLKAPSVLVDEVPVTDVR
jgi:hypothetical protein